MIQVWRTTRRAYAEAAFSGEGARLYGGRWGQRGVPLAYASATLSLSVLEVLTQVVSYEDLADYVAIPAAFDEALAQELEAEDLPADWRAHPAPESTKALGTAWARSNRSLVLRIPSVVLPSEANYLINPRHPAFGQVELGAPQDLDIDPRLLKQ